ncbi:hypothetical protein PG993_013771 [Apiospora rasikravindrae]|uniref:PH domain-containing protein n=1 Tax=Apiospora rasikravindrae TaxID=990691 RepID=A0ABR1RR58_9PEZI
MEGTLLIPPDRGNILGRALWKSRYVVVGSPQREGNMDANQPPNNLSLSQVLSATRIKDSREKSIKLPPRMSPDSIYLSLYKSKDDWEPSQQYSMASIADCQVQMVAHRKQGPALPTLVMQIKPDPTTDKLRKRRSSRTAGLTREKESGPTTLWFRPSEEGGYALQDWARYISSLLPPREHDAYPMSPVTPASPTFSNPFSPRRDGGQFRPGSRDQEQPVRPTIQHKRSGFTRERPHTFSSESPSLRSRKSDISSHGSSLNAMGMGYVIHGDRYTTVLPTDLPSPATTVGEVPSEYTLGWTNAQGRSSTLSSPVRARGSVSSQGQAPCSQASSSPPPARESILDRAFQLRCIPGVETEVPGEYNLSSLARFDALMREAEERRKKERAQNPPITPMTSTFEEDEDTDEQDTAKIANKVKSEVVEESEEDVDEEEESSDDDVFDHDVTRDRASIGPSAQRALAFIANRHSTMAQGGRATQSYHPDNGYSILRPHTAHSRMRPAAMQRGGSQPHVPLAATAMENQRASMRDHLVRHEKRHSTSSVKRLSFNEFTKRLSSTSSLLLSPNNGGGPGSPGEQRERGYTAAYYVYIPSRTSPSTRNPFAELPELEGFGAMRLARQCWCIWSR